MNLTTCNKNTSYYKIDATIAKTTNIPINHVIIFNGQAHSSMRSTHPTTPILFYELI